MAPPHKELNKEQFKSSLSVVALRVQPKDCHVVSQALRAYTLRRRGVRTVTVDPSDPAKKSRLVLLDPDTIPSAQDWKERLSEEVREKLGRVEANAVRHEVELSYENLSCREVLRQLLPKAISDVPSSFETVGHVAHLNLREELLPYKELIGQVALEVKGSRFCIRGTVNG